MAFAFQLLLTNLGVALGLSALGWAISPNASASASLNIDAGDVEAEKSESDEGGVPPVSHLLGIGVTLTLASVLFATAFLATVFSGILQFLTGVIFGLILWAAYVLILIWISSVTVSGILDFVLGTATEGIRRLFLGVAQLFQSDGSKTDLSKTDLSKADSKEDLLHQVEVLSSEVKKALSEQQALPVLLAQQRETLLKEICDRTNLNQDQAASVLDSIDTEPERSEAAAAKATNITTGDISTEVSITEGDRSPYKKSAMALAKMLPNWRELLRMAVSRLDTSDLDLETTWNTFQRFVGEEEVTPFNTIALDAENYLREAPVYSLQAETLPEEFTERIYDPEANPGAVAKQVRVLEQADFEQWLQARGDLREEAVEEITDRLVAVREEVLEQVEEAAEQLSTRLSAEVELGAGSSLSKVTEELALTAEEKAIADKAIAALEDKLTAYFRYTTLNKLSAQSVEEKLSALSEEIEHFEQEISRWVESGVVLNYGAIAQTLSRRKGITQQQQNELMSALETIWESYRPKPVTVPLSQKMTNYLQAIDWSESNIEELKGEILQQIEIGLSSPNGFSEGLDVGKLASSLSVPDSVKADLFALIQTEGQPLLRRPRRWVERAASTSGYWGTRLARQVGQYVASRDSSAQGLAGEVEDVVRETSRVVQAAAQSMPVEQIPHLGVEFWRQALGYLPDADSIKVDSMASHLAEAWQSTAQTLPELTDRLKQQSAAQLQDIQTVAQSITRFVSDDVVDPVLDAVPALNDLLEPTKQKFVAALDLAQDSFSRQTALVAQDLQRRAESVRRQVAIAAWWLFISLFASGAAAAMGGWLAVWVRLRA